MSNTKPEAKSLKDILLEKIPAEVVVKITAYINGALRDEAAAKAKDPKKSTPVSNNTTSQLYTLAIKYYNLGLPLDGVNVVITGRNMAMVTYHGYKNKVLQVYPETEFDIQLFREGDTFQVSKESGEIIYSHTIANPFGNAPIEGAYVVFKNKRGQYLETLNKDDFERMKKASKQSYLWGEWESEFWLKSVIKRACKRHFFDVVAEIDKVDNDNFGLNPEDKPEEDTDKIEAAIASIKTAADLDQLRAIFLGLGQLGAQTVVFEAKEAKKEELLAKPPTKKVKVKKVAPKEKETVNENS